MHRKNLAAAGPEKFTMEFIEKQVEEFNIGKRHLANMMGEDPDNFTQEDIDVRIDALGHVWTSIWIDLWFRSAALQPFAQSSSTRHEWSSIWSKFAIWNLHFAPH